jgi:3-dehydroquinate dehydratase II
MPGPVVFVLNGPNLNLLGEREPEIYGRATLTEIEERTRRRAGTCDLAIEFRQTNFEGVLIEHVHEARKAAGGIIINPAGLTFTSVALLDALKMFDGPKIELHISNIHKREEIYHKSLISRTATAVIAGLGPSGYEISVLAMRSLIDEREAKVAS